MLISDLDSLAGRFRLLAKIGSGAFGSVYSGKVFNRQKTDVAIKIIRIEQDGGNKNDILNELKILEKLDNPYIIKYHGAFQFENAICIVTELCLCDFRCIMQISKCIFFLSLLSRIGCGHIRSDPVVNWY